MSLINDMLRDLESERQPQKLRPASPASRARVRGGLAIIAGVGAFVLVSVLLLISWWPEAEPDVEANPAPMDSVVSAPAPPIEKPAVLASENTATPREEARVEPASKNEPAPQAANQYPPPSQQLPLVEQPPSEPTREKTEAPWQKDLARAEQALLVDRLTRPAHDSAYLYYQRVLAAAPGNVEALAGIERIAERYHQLAESALAAGNNLQARRYWERALRVQPDFAVAQASLQRLEEQPVEASLEIAPGQTEEVATTTTTAAEAEVSAKTSILETETQRRAVQPSSASREQRQLRKAEALVARGETAAARAALQEYLNTADSQGEAAPEARRYLLGLYEQAGDRAAAEALITASLPDHLRACLQARLQLNDKQPEAALALLEQAEVVRSQDESCRAMLAGLYHRTGQYASAQNHYSRLLDHFGERGRYWLGLAMALDGRQAYPAASAAYRQVLQSRDASPELMDFARERLAQLNN